MENNIAILDSKTTEIKQLFAPTLTQIEFDYFISLAKSLNANPFKKEIYAIKYGNQLSVFCGRDLYRRIAQEQPDYLVHIASAIYENDTYEKTNGKVTHKTSLKNRGALIGAYCSLWKKNCDIPFTVEVLFSEYKKTTKIWQDIPATMICKVAESQVLRMAYQGIFAGTYEESEKWEIAETVNNSVSCEIVEIPKAKETISPERFLAMLQSITDNKTTFDKVKDRFAFNENQIAILKEQGYISYVE